MITTPQFAPLVAEKHDLSNILICLVDTRARILWTSDDPLNERGHVGHAALDLYPEIIRPRVLHLLSRCILEGKVESYTEKATKLPSESNGRLYLWRITMLPVDQPNLAAMLIASVLPDCYGEITGDEKSLLRMLADDKTLKEIAGSMNRSESAIDSKMRLLKQKLGRTTIGGLVALALREFVI